MHFSRDVLIKSDQLKSSPLHCDKESLSHPRMILPLCNFKSCPYNTSKKHRHSHYSLPVGKEGGSLCERVSKSKRLEGQFNYTACDCLRCRSEKEVFVATPTSFSSSPILHHISTTISICWPLSTQRGGGLNENPGVTQISV